MAASHDATSGEEDPRIVLRRRQMEAGKALAECRKAADEQAEALSAVLQETNGEITKLKTSWTKVEAGAADVEKELQERAAQLKSEIKKGAKKT
eukprot:TRINITY_DN108335_c0_g1_i1.p2 TRINITY_DN108335_c0_g1~~TRINITY_DN108335_c0_g1_i1.p2  ORF type:complete len:102 (-),score=36.83 TRINITY_DN108335_c0_g1_i1:9-290(-)